MRRWRSWAMVMALFFGLGLTGAARAQDEAAPPVQEPVPAAAPANAEPAPAADVVNPPAVNAAVNAAEGESHGEFQYFEFLKNPAYGFWEQVGLFATLIVAIAGLLYAVALVAQVSGADQGTPKMQEVAAAIRQGANAYLGQQFRAIILLVFLITAILYFTAQSIQVIALGRAAAFFMGAAFSWLVGFVGMRLAVRGNLRVAAAARTSYGTALQLGYRTGTITGMLTDGLGLLGGTLIFMVYGEKAYEVLLGFGFGGTLLALFMRVGGGIYTKAADVGADLVGKVEANIPEDDPRNAATIADNVGDNVGDCAGMAADIFESYEVTIVAAMILGYASFGHKGVIFPLLVRAIGVIGSIISTYSVKAGPDATSDEALHSVHHGFVLGSIISTIGFMLLGGLYLHFNDDYMREYPQALGGYSKSPEFSAAYAAYQHGRDELDAARSSARARKVAEPTALSADQIALSIADWQAFYKTQNPEANTETNAVTTAFQAGATGVAPRNWIETSWPKDQRILGEQPWWATLFVGSSFGLDMRPAFTCLIGILLAIALNKVTSYYTHTQFAPVKSMAKACQTGHATNIIQGFAVGYESAVVATLVIAGAILLSVLIYWGTSPIFIAYGVAMCGIGMLTLTGNTISMDVFGPVADNANGIGEMAYDAAEMGEENHRRARQILSDLDAVGNTTKAETKGIAIGSAVIAAVSLFASFIAVIAVGSEDKIDQMTVTQYLTEAGRLSVAQPMVFIGALIGGTVPFLFSSMLIRAVGRAAFLIVKECRVQFRDKEIWAGTKKPDYGRVVNICTASAQRELIGPALLAILMPILVGCWFGAQALGGYLAGMIIVGQLLAVFMANAGGAWDNAKKAVEDEPRTAYTGKGSEKHKAAVTGDTVGDPLKDTAGPALNPLIKVMNMVALLAIGAILAVDNAGNRWILYLIGVACVVGIAWAVYRSKTESKELREMEAELTGVADQSLEEVSAP